jgi:heme exporter protein C
MLRFANPTRFLGLARVLIPVLGAVAAVLLAVGLTMVFFVSPEDYQQGATVRIMYIHVPAAWLSMACYTLMALSGIGTLVWRHPLADVSAKAAAPLGAAFTLLCLVTGSLWGKPMWGTWWVWDARLTSVLVLFLMYCGVIALWNAIEDPTRAGRSVAVLTLVGFVNIPIVKFSVDWWNTLHQPASVIRMGGPTLDPSMLWPLLVMAVGATCLFLTLHLAGMRNEILRRRVRALGLVAAQREDLPLASEAKA